VIGWSNGGSAPSPDHLWVSRVRYGGRSHELRKAIWLVLIAESALIQAAFLRKIGQATKKEPPEPAARSGKQGGVKVQKMVDAPINDLETLTRS